MVEIESVLEHSTVKHKLKKQQRQLFMQRLLSNKQILTGGSLLLILIMITVFGPLLVPFSPYQMEVMDRLLAPNGLHLLGTDEFGRDLLTRIIYGGRITIGVGLSVALISSVLGLIVGLYASYYRALDQILMRICDGLMAIPAILLAIALMAALGPNTLNVIIALSIVFTPYIARVIRSSALVVREQTYIEAMRAQGASNLRIIWRHIMPNTISPLVIQATFIFAEAIIIEAALSFLGAGVPAPEPSWGSILHDGKTVIFNAWWMTVFPGITIVMSVLGLNLLGDGLRDLIDPHTNHAKK
ncbi:ABC transporter permease [Bacillus sp. JJ1503]|uniref:ABC transporter permease n=1 Tax=unclassified Bacillus (in: firmicutes) TaxID=185979 RepID=UPI003000F035